MNIIALDDEEFALAALNDAICEALPQENPVCFNNAEDVLAYAKRGPIDVAFLDINMDGMSGVELAEKLTEICPTINLIFVTGFSEYFDKAFELYASGYVKKPVRAKRILREMEHLRYPMTTKRRAVQELGPYLLDHTAQRVYVNGKDALLKPKEFMLFCLFADHPDMYFTPEDLYKRIWGGNPNGNLNTVYVRMSDLRRKLGRDEENDFIIEHKRGKGYRIVKNI